MLAPTLFIPKTAPAFRYLSLLPALLLQGLFLVGCQRAEIPSQPTDDSPEAASAMMVASGTYSMVAVHSGKCVDVGAWSKDNGGNIIQWPCTGGANQQWILNSLGGGIYESRNVNSGKCADIEAWSTANGGNIHQWDCLGQNNQKWVVSDMGNGEYQFKSVHSGKCIDVAGISTADGANIQQWDCVVGGQQRFKLVPVGSTPPIVITPPVVVPPVVIPPVTTACKRGLAYGGNSAADLQSLSRGISWWYNWATVADPGVAATYATSGVEFVPMVWGPNFIAEAEANIKPGAKYLLAFNEPNFYAQSNVSAAQAAALWPDIERIATKYNLKIVSPATNFCAGACHDTDPYHWLQDFFAACPACRVDYIAAHWYACTGDALKWHLGNLKQFNRPIWLTEFSCLDQADKSVAVQKAYMNTALDILEKDTSVFRYAWFTGRDAGVPSISLLGGSGELTELGQQYVNFPQACKQ